MQWFDVSADGTVAVIHVWDTLYTLDLSRPNAQPVALTITANEDESDNYEIKAMNKSVSEAALSPDGKVMAFIAYGDVFVRNLEEKSPSRNITNSHSREQGIAWSPDGVKLYYTSDHDGTESIYAASVTLTRSEMKESFEETTNPPKEEVEPEAEPEEEAEKGDAEAEENAETQPDTDTPEEEKSDEQGEENGDAKK